MGRVTSRLEPIESKAPFFMANLKIYTVAEREFLIKATGGGAPMQELWEVLFNQQGVDNERDWLREEIIDLSGTPISNYDSDLWKQLNALSCFNVSKYSDENRLTYFINWTPEAGVTPLQGNPIGLLLSLTYANDV